MKLVKCRCGYAFNFSAPGVPGEQAYVSTRNWDELVAALASAADPALDTKPELLRERISDALAVRLETFLRCPS
jgi:hypothetical protein